MKVLYFTNKDINDPELIPSIIKENDECISYNEKITLDFIRKNKIEFIVSDRSRSLINEEIINFFVEIIFQLIVGILFIVLKLQLEIIKLHSIFYLRTIIPK